MKYRWLYLLFLSLLLLAPLPLGCQCNSSSFRCNPYDRLFDYAMCSCTYPSDCPQDSICTGTRCSKQTSERSMSREPLHEHSEPTQDNTHENTHDTDVDAASENHPPEQKHLEDPSAQCTADETIPCYTGPEQTRGRGICKAGVRHCIGGRFSKICSKEIKPRSESCNGLDDDCDGKIDNVPHGCACKSNEKRTCYEGPKGQDIRLPCKKGWQTCTNNQWGRCEGDVLPKTEICNNKDDDCDGNVDEKLYRACKTTCGSGTQICLRGAWQTCSARIPSSEICNSKDDDCDGKVDNIAKQTCTTACGTGQESCVLGKWINCTARTPGPKELCNNKDDDCNGKVDENLQRTCNSACEKGRETCTKGVWSTCSARQPTTEICNQRDDDCDGQTDEDNVCGQCVPLSTRSCGLDTGECKRGLQECTAARTWSNVCKNEIKAKPEICNNKDDDCDGQVDESLTQACTTKCGTGQQTCARGVWSTCPVRQPVPEICNSKDDDCDGQTDEENPGGGTTCTVPGKQGPCQKGQRFCKQGTLICLSSYVSKPETCNNQDDDCDGQIDNQIASTTCYTGTVGTAGVGVCQEGQTQCRGGKIVCIGETIPSTEQCDGKDTDCNGDPDACTKNQIRCKNKTLIRCADDCERWLRTSQCTMGCNSQGTQCCVCRAGSVQCTSGQLLTCAADCMSWLPPQNCISACQNDTCCTCKPGMVQCLPDRSGIARCAPDCKTLLLLKQCQQGYMCNAATCVPQK